MGVRIIATGRVTFEVGGHVPAIVTYLCMGAVRIVRLPPHASDESIRHREG